MNSATNDDLDLITIMELAALLRVGRTGLWRICKDPAFPRPIMIGRRRRWRRADLERWVDGKSGGQLAEASTTPAGACAAAAPAAPTPRSRPAQMAPREDLAAGDRQLPPERRPVHGRRARRAGPPAAPAAEVTAASAAPSPPAKPRVALETVPPTGIGPRNETDGPIRPGDPVPRGSEGA